MFHAQYSGLLVFCVGYRKKSGKIGFEQFQEFATRYPLAMFPLYQVRVIRHKQVLTLVFIHQVWSLL